MDTSHYKELLDAEKKTLIEELTTLGHINPDNAEEWELNPEDLDIMEADRNEAADRVEEQQIDQSVLDTLEVRYRLILHALTRIDNGTYGTCEVSGKAIEADRLEANPAARTCKEHMEEESKLPL